MVISFCCSLLLIFSNNLCGFVFDHRAGWLGATIGYSTA